MSQPIIEQLDQSGLFRTFPDDVKADIAANARAKAFTDGTKIYRSGEAPDYLYGLVEGGVKLTGEDASGKLFVYGVIMPGWWFGEISALDGLPRAQNALAVGDCKVIAVSREYLMRLLELRPELYRYFFDILCSRLRQAGGVIEEAAFLSTAKRLAKYLLRIHDYRHRYEIKLTQEELAASLGVSRQSIYRTIKDWQKQQWVAVQYGDIKVLNELALRNVLAED